MKGIDHSGNIDNSFFQSVGRIMSYWQGNLFIQNCEALRRDHHQMIAGKLYFTRPRGLETPTYRLQDRPYIEEKKEDIF